MVEYNTDKERDVRTINLGDMIVGYYLGKGRNADVGYWDGYIFHILKFWYGASGVVHGDADVEEHWDAHPKYGTFQPYRLIKEVK